MALPRDYTNQVCSVARALEIVGERWTLLIVRDAFYGVRRFSDFRSHLGIPRAVLSERLASLVGEGIMDRVPGSGGHDEYQLTTKGVGLRAALRALSGWGDSHYAPNGPAREFFHAECGGRLDPTDRCAVCERQVPARDIITSPGPGWKFDGTPVDPVTKALDGPHRLLTALDTTGGDRSARRSG